MSHTAIRAISVVALIVAILVHNVTAWIFSLAPAHEFWHTALMGPWFVASALDCGTALVLIVCLALRRAGYLALDQGHVANLAKMLAVFVLVDLYFYACDLLTSGYFGGRGAPKSWRCSPPARFRPSSGRRSRSWPSRSPSSSCRSCARPPASIEASVLAILGVFCKRLQILVGGFQIPNLPYDGPMTSMTVTSWQNGMAGALSGHGLCSAADRIRRHARRARHVRSVLAARPEVPALEACRERRLAPLFSSEPDAAPLQICRVRLLFL